MTADPSPAAGMQGVALVLPAYRPGPVLLEVLQALAPHAFDAIVVIDDGSGPDYDPMFDRAASVPGVTLLRHADNRGKGAALKTGFRHLLEGATPPARWLVTLDADGQHCVDDVVAISEAGRQIPGALLLGVRDFGAANMPWRSRFGNTLTRRVLRRTHGLDLADTQTGLRCLPAGFARETLAIEADRYDFELECLLLARARRRPIKQHPIRTIYIDDNAASHFRPLVDSFRVYRVIFRRRPVARDS